MTRSHAPAPVRVSVPADVPAGWSLAGETSGDDVRLLATFSSPCGGTLVLVVDGLHPVAAGCADEQRSRFAPGSAGMTLEVRAEGLRDPIGAVAACQELLASLGVTSWPVGRARAHSRSPRQHRARDASPRR